MTIVRRKITPLINVIVIVGYESEEEEPVAEDKCFIISHGLQIAHPYVHDKSKSMLYLHIFYLIRTNIIEKAKKLLSMLMFFLPALIKRLLTEVYYLCHPQKL
uniref:Uncharacterized protein n=1 Tax=Micrurus carvalhoi TaxID=3147026 RepID=A0A2H6NKI6_9SAUR